MKTAITQPELATTRGWVFYDGQCPLCIGLAQRCQWLLFHYGFDLATLQTGWVCHRFGLDPNTRPEEMLVILPDGEVAGGADGFVQIARRIWWAWPLFALAQLPGVMGMLRTIYRRVAARRYCLGGIFATATKVRDVAGKPRPEMPEIFKCKTRRVFFEMP